MKKIYRLKNRRRFVTFIFLLFVFVLFIGSVASAGKNIKNEYQTVTVRKGDTLWHIACKHSGTMEIRRYIYEIKKINKLNNATIYAGQKLNLP